MCTKLYSEELQPLDPTQEPVFPPKLMLCSFFLISFSFYVNYKGINSPSAHPQVILSSIFNSMSQPECQKGIKHLQNKALSPL